LLPGQLGAAKGGERHAGIDMMRPNQSHGQSADLKHAQMKANAAHSDARNVSLDNLANKDKARRTTKFVAGFQNAKTRKAAQPSLHSQPRSHPSKMAHHATSNPKSQIDPAADQAAASQSKILAN